MCDALFQTVRTQIRKLRLGSNAYRSNTSGRLKRTAIGSEALGGSQGSVMSAAHKLRR